MRRYLLYFLLFCSLIFNVSCKKDKFKAPQASFLVVDNASLKTNYSTQGTNSSKITDMWYYVDGQFKGCFPVGGVMPIVAKGKAEITLFAGIKNNGISATRIPYPIYSSQVINLDIEAGKTYTISPQFQYNTTAYFYYHDDFDGVSGSGQYIGPDPGPTGTNCRLTTSAETHLAFGGTGQSYYMTMTDAQPISRLLQTTGTYLPAGGATVYVELNYRCNQPVTIGVIGGGTDQRGAITLNTSEEWNKIYVQLTSIVSTQPIYSSYQVFIEARKLVDNPEIYIDNVKLIYQ